MIDKIDLYKDLFIYIIASIILWLILSYFDAFEVIVDYLHEHEEYEVDEILLLMIVFGFLSIFYTIKKVSEAKKINMKLENLNEELEKKVLNEISKRKEQEFILIQQSKLASMGEMIGNIAHQWRQPLNSLGLVIQNIKFSYDTDDLDDEFMDRSIEKANKITKSMSKTIDDFRGFFNPNKEKEEFTLSSRIKKTMSLLESSLDHHNINMSFDDSCEIKVFGFENEFSQALLNILSNAKDALIDNNITNAYIKIKVDSDSKYGRVIIEDNAGGINSEIINKIFEPYFTTKKVGKGTGIGLYMSKIIIEQNMNGALNVNNLDNGAQFEIKIPFKNEK